MIITKRIFKATISLLLVIAIIGTSCVFASESGAMDYRQTQIYWIKNSDRFEKLFNTKSINGNTYLVSDKLSIDEKNGSEAGYPAKYQLLLGNTKITLEGSLKTESAANGVYYTGLMTSSVVINDAEYLISCALYAKQNEEWLNAGVSISSINAQNFDDMVFLGIGDPLNLEEMGLNLSPEQKPNIQICDNPVPANNTRDDNGSGYIFKGNKNLFSSQANGYAEHFKVYYHQSWERVCIGVYSNTSGIISYFTGNDSVPYAYVNSIKMGLKPTSEGAHYVSGLYNYPQNLNYQNNSTLFNSSFISAILDIVSNSIHPGITQTALSALSAILSLCKNKANAGTSWEATQSDTYVNFNFAQTIWSYSNIQFNNDPITVKYGIAASQTGTYSFTAYSSMSYFVLIAHPEANNSTTLYVNIPQGNLTISSFYIDNSD